MSKSNEYGYIQDGPTQSSSSNSGVFEVNDVVDLINQSKWTLQTAVISYLVVAGGGGSGTGNDAPGGGGAGGFCLLHDWHGRCSICSAVLPHVLQPLFGF